jgi:uncharacterized protein (TIGR02266 family)
MSNPEEPSDKAKAREPRTALSTLVQFRFNTVEEFLAEYSVNLSTSGIFIRADQIPEVGAAVYLQFTLSDGSRLIEGLGRVARVVRPTPGGPPAGFGVEFVGLDDESLALVKRLSEAGAEPGTAAGTVASSAPREGSG